VANWFFPWYVVPVKIERRGAQMGLSTVQEIERAIRALKPRELEELYSWLDQDCPQPLDTRVQSDLTAGCLDKAIHRALDDENNGRVRPL
jgi:hypothetical protein